MCRSVAGMQDSRIPSAKCPASELPSGKYCDIPVPSTVLLRRAAEPAHPVLPRQGQGREWPKTVRDRHPLESSLTGCGRAGKVGCLSGSSGSKYVGQILAGRPHGHGKMYVPAPQPGKPLWLAFQGDFVKGVREGNGTCWYSNNEVYTGGWQANQRTGPGKLEHADGAVYEGMWQADRRHGVGTLQSPNGDIFVGSFVDDKRQGMGTTYMPIRGKKYVAEYVDDMPSCGTFYELCTDGIEAPPTQQMRNAVTSQMLQQLAATGRQPASLPVLQLVQPSKVLSKEFVVVRHNREQHQALAAAVQASGNTLSADNVSLLRHAFILITGGDDMASSLLPHQLQELVVLAGFDPAASPGVQLVAQLRALASSSSGNSSSGSSVSGSRAGGQLSLDQFLHLVCHFREQPLAVVGAAGSAVPTSLEAAASAGDVLLPSAAAADDDDDDDDDAAHAGDEHWAYDAAAVAFEASVHFRQQQQQQEEEEEEGEEGTADAGQGAAAALVPAQQQDVGMPARAEQHGSSCQGTATDLEHIMMLSRSSNETQ